MGRTPCCEKQGLKKGPWTPEEDKILVDYIQAHGHGVWRSLPKQAGLLRCGKSCRLRWINYLRPDIRRGPFTPEEQERIVQLHGIVGNKWSAIAAQMPGRTDNEVKNYWNTHLRKRLFRRAPKASAFLPPPSPCARADSGGGGGGGFTHHAARQGGAKWEDDDNCHSADLPLPSPHRADVRPFPAEKAAQPDVFLRIWHSEVGAAFRVRGSAATTAAVSPASSSAMHGSSVTIKEEDAEGRAGPDAACIDEPKQIGDYCRSSGGGGRGDAGACSWSSIDTGKEMAEKAPEAYLSFIGEDMELAGLFPEALGCFSWLGGDPVEEVYMDCK